MHQYFRKSRWFLGFQLWSLLAISAFAELELQHAQHFKIENFGAGHIVHSVSPWPASKMEYKTLVWPKNLELPQNNTLPVVRTPVQRIITHSTTDIGLLSALGCEDLIVAISDGKHINQEKLALAYESGQLPEVGQQGQLNVEAIIELQPDVLLTYALNATEAPFLDKLCRAKIPHIVMGSFAESSALARSEWVLLVGLITGKLTEAQQHFKMVEANYAALCEKTKLLKHRPKVFCNLPFGGVWYMPQGQSWVAQILHDAGADYPWANSEGTGSFPLTSESVFEKALDAEIWINPSQDPLFTYEKMFALDRRYQQFKAAQNKKCLVATRQVNKFGGNNIYELGIARPDIILADLVFHLHPTALPEHQPVFYQWMPSQP
jgi:iron complex transport system substrate-binding protein